MAHACSTGSRCWRRASLLTVPKRSRSQHTARFANCAWGQTSPRCRRHRGRLPGEPVSHLFRELALIFRAHVAGAPPRHASLLPHIDRLLLDALMAGAERPAVAALVGLRRNPLSNRSPCAPTMIEVNFLGVQLPWLLLLASRRAAVLPGQCAGCMAIVGAYRWIWHPPCLTLLCALYVLVLGAMASLAGATAASILKSGPLQPMKPDAPSLCPSRLPVLPVPSFVCWSPC